MITELKLSPLEAYKHIFDLLTEANSLIGSLIVRDLHLENEQRELKIEAKSSSKEEEEDKEINIVN